MDTGAAVSPGYIYIYIYGGRWGRNNTYSISVVIPYLFHLNIMHDINGSFSSNDLSDSHVQHTGMDHE